MWQSIVSGVSLAVLTAGHLGASQVQPVSLDLSGWRLRVATTEANERVLAERPARLNVKNVSLEAGLIALRERSGVPLGFSPSRVQGYDGVSCDCEAATVGEALGRMLKGTPFGFVETPARILVSRSPEVKSEPNRDLAERSVNGSSASRPPPELPTVRIARPVFARQGTVTGQVTVVESQRPLDGAQVQITGTNLSTLTDREGQFRIQNVPAGEVEVQVRRIGYVAGSQRVVVASGATVTVDFQLEQDVLALDELVVTALGIERGARSLTYSTQSINTAPLTEARELNVINSLQGKVAGLSINQSATGVGGDSRVILRGNRSITGSSQPLYVLDGVPIRGDIRDINPDDIATIDVLKGPNAAALYGAAAQNGAIVMTTHRGAADAIQFSVNQTFMVENPILADNYQNAYGQGTGGLYNRNSEFSWGPRMDGQMVDYWAFNDSDHMSGRQYAFLPQPNNIRDAFRTGYNSATNVTASIGREETQAHVSFTYTDAEGMIPGNDLRRSNLSLSVRSTPLDRLSVDGRLSYMRQSIENQLATGENFANPLRHIYRLPRNIRTEDIEPFEYNNIDGHDRQNYFNVGSNGGANPYWTLSRNLSERLRNRVLAVGSMTYSLTDELRLLARASYDASTDDLEIRRHNDTYVIAPFGRYELRKDEATLFNGDALLSYTRNVGVDWSFDTNVGGNVQQRRNTFMTSHTGTGLIVPNFFTLSNSLNPSATHNVGQPVDVHSLYGFAQIGWRHAVYLDISGRNDWSSTLPASNRSYFYPSVGLSTVLSDLVTLPEPLASARLRASWARVGSDTDPFRLTRLTSFLPGGNNGFLRLSGTLPNEDLRPEQTESIELGADVRFLQGRLGLDVTWYKMNTTDQLFTVALPVGSGASEFFTNGGDVENAGIEFLLSSVPLETSGFRWELDANYARNRNMVKAINDERPSLVLTSDFLREFRIEEGQPFGQVYSRGFQRDDQGRVIVGSNGVPLVTSGRVVPVANFNPDWTAGISNTVRYGNLYLNFLVDHRQGGTIASLRNAILYADGLTTATLEGREGGIVFGQNFFSHETSVLEDGSPNNIETDAETFWRAVGGRNAPVGEAFVEDATNTRLRELTLGYTFPAGSLARMPVSAMTVSLVGRNLFFIHKASQNLDPDILVGTGASAEGFESFTPPTARTFGMNVRFTF